jgi:hypothetical protein
VHCEKSVRGARLQRSNQKRGNPAAEHDRNQRRFDEQLVSVGLIGGFCGSRSRHRHLIYGAATDGTNYLRYFCGEDTGDLVKARRELPEDIFLNLMRSCFSAGNQKTACREEMKTLFTYEHSNHAGFPSTFNMAASILSGGLQPAFPFQADC